MVIQILGMEESESLIYDLGMFLKKSKIKHINLRTQQRDVLIDHQNIEFFKSDSILEQIKTVCKIKNEFDLCIVSSWKTARIAYLADLNYIIWFVGNDIRIPPFVRHSKPEYFDMPVNQLNFLERIFYKKILENALVSVTGSQELFQYLEKYRKDAIRIDRVVVNTKIFNNNPEPINLIKKKFMFFSPQRMGIEKGTDILWKALPLCKSDFEIIQVNWFDEKSKEAKKTSNKLLKTIPSKVRLIAPIKKHKMSNYYAFADAIIGDMRSGHTNSIEREAVWCKKPVISYNDTNSKSLIDGKEIASPFLPISQDPQKLAEIIDKVVDDKDFRKKLLSEEFDYVKIISDPEKTAEEWDNLFERLNKKSKLRKNKSPIVKKLRILFFLFADKINPKKNQSKLHIV